ncbi:MAG: PilZ domain-containing protein [Elusimicrobia bacterium]|nr:PilZ domain-containing protein [Elusimicrobiota bacterium]
MSLMPGAKERRRYVRHQKDLKLALSNERGPIAEPSLMDISPAGMGLLVSDNPVPGQAFRFKLELPSGPVQGKAVVVWAKPHHLGWRCGVKFVKIGCFQRRRLRVYLEPQQFDWLRFADKILILAAVVTAALVLADYFGLLKR